MANSVQELQAILDQMNKIKEEMLQDVREKAAILNLKLVPANDNDPASKPKQKRARRTKAQIQADNDNAARLPPALPKAEL
jgi:hypothetical protein